MSALFAATYPERVTSLILFGAFAKRLWSPDYPWGPTLAERTAWINRLEAGWGGELELSTLAPSMVNDPGFRKWFATYGRLSVSPSAAVALAKMNTDIDIRNVLSAIHVPTLVLHRTGDRDVVVGNGRYLAEHIVGAKYEEFPGEDHVWWIGDSDAILGEIQEFLTGIRSPAPVDRVLATILFTDVVGSSQIATRLGDAKWAQTLIRHNQAIRRAIDRFGGKEIKSTGDGFLATFDGPARGIRCAVAIRQSMRELEIPIRIGLHTGECEKLGSDIGGIGVHIASRVAAMSEEGTVLVTRTVKDLVSGSGVEFADRGEHSLRGVEGSWRLYEVRSAD